MSMQLEPYNHMNDKLMFNQVWAEQILLQISDTFDIRIECPNEGSVLLTGALALVGGFLGGYAGGRLGAALGAGIGGAAGVGVANAVALREIWEQIKEKAKVVLYIIYNYLRRMDAVDYERAFRLVMACAVSRKDLKYDINDNIQPTNSCLSHKVCPISPVGLLLNTIPIH